MSCDFRRIQVNYNSQSFLLIESETFVYLSSSRKKEQGLYYGTLN